MSTGWLLKTEPSAYSFAQLLRERSTTWDGVKNPVALKNLRQVRPDDRILIYHTGDEKAVVGVARATSAAYADPKGKDEKLVVIDIAAVEALEQPVTLKQLKAQSGWKDSDLVRQPRLSVMPISAEQWRDIERLARG